MSQCIIPREIYLYRCEQCKTVVALDDDRGTEFYMDQCVACKSWSDHEKISVRMLGVGRQCHYGFTVMNEEKKDGSEGTEEKEQTNLNRSVDQ